MTDEQLLRSLGSWLKDSDIAAPDSRRTVRRVTARLPQTRQRGRWWPMPFSRRTPTRVAGLPGIESQPDPISPASGRSTIATRRTQLMFSPAKAITAGALVFALGSVLLIAQPFEQQRVVPDAAADPGLAAPVEFTGRLIAPCRREGELAELPGDIKRFVGAPCRPELFEISDPRLDGEVTIVENYDFHRPALDGSTPATTLWHERIDIETEAGAWRSRPVLLFAAANGRPSATTYVFVGEGAYEGLTAFAELVIRDGDRGRDIRGFIIDGDTPAAPTVPTE